MTNGEQDAEFGRLLRERATLKTSVKCLKSKLDRSARAFRAAAENIEADTEWSLKKAKDGLVVPSASVDAVADSLILPSTDDLDRWLSERWDAERRIATINEYLPD